MAPVETPRDVFDSGPLFRLLGTFLGSRPECVEDEHIDRLIALVDAAEPMPALAVGKALAAAWETAPDAVLGTFSAMPFATRTIDQFHAATLPNGTAVTVRIIRPAAQELVAEARRQSAALSAAIAAYCLPRQGTNESVRADFLAWLTAECDAEATAADAAALVRELSTAQAAVARSEGGRVATAWTGAASGGGDALALFALDTALLRAAIPEQLTAANIGVGVDGKPVWLSAAGARAMTLRDARAVRDLWAALHVDDEAMALRALRRSRSDAEADWNRFEQLSLAAIRRHVAFPADDVSPDRAIHRVDRILLGILRAARATGVTMPPAVVRAHRLLIVAYRQAHLERPQAQPERIGRERLAQFDQEDRLGGISSDDLGKLGVELLGLLRETPARLNQIAADLVDGNLVVSVVSEESPRTSAAWTRRVRLFATALASVGLAVLFAQSAAVTAAGLPLQPILGLALVGLWVGLAVQWLRLK